MPLTGRRTFVGFGFGAIQSGLFLYEAFQSGAFRRLVVAEVLPEVVEAVRREGGSFCVNIARHDRVESACIGPVEIYNPGVEADRLALVAAIGEAEEIATAVPSVAFYVSDKPGSIHSLLAEGLCQKVERGGARAVIYAAENHNHAAEILEAAVMGLVPPEQQAAVRARVRFLNTVIGKMSQVVADPDGEPLAPGHHAMRARGVAARVAHNQAPAGTQGVKGLLENPRLQLAREVVQHVAQQHRVASRPRDRKQVALLKTQP